MQSCVICVCERPEHIVIALLLLPVPVLVLVLHLG